jgi:hypothetical protein
MPLPLLQTIMMAIQTQTQTIPQLPKNYTGQMNLNMAIGFGGMFQMSMVARVNAGQPHCGSCGRK